MSDTATYVPPAVRPPTATPKPPDFAWARRYARVTAALALLAAAAYAVLSGQGYVATDDAVVSAYTVSLRVPISGYLSDLHAKVGTPVVTGMVLAHLNEPRVDDERLVDLENLVKRLSAERDGYERERDQLSRLQTALAARSVEYNRSEAEYLTLQAAEAERQARAREASRDYDRLELERTATLGRSGDASVAAVDKARATVDESDRDTEAAIARLAYLRVQAAAARGGVILENGSNDVPYSSQRADEIAVRLSEIERQIASLSASIAEASGRLGSERRRIAMLRDADIVAPSSGMLWKLAASDGEHLSVGDPAAEVVDCQSTFIVAAIPQNRYSDVEIGGEARVRLSGEGSDRHGRVVSVMGQTDLANNRNLAAVPVASGNLTATARIELAGAGNTAGECLVGRTARVLMPASADSGVAARLWRRLF